MSPRLPSVFLITTVVASAILAVPLTSARADSSADPGAGLYKSKCASCHGPDGSGNIPMGKALKVRDLSSDEVQKQTDLQLAKVIADGKGKMPPYGKKLTTEEIQSIITFVRTLKK